MNWLPLLLLIYISQLILHARKSKYSRSEAAHRHNKYTTRWEYNNINKRRKKHCHKSQIDINTTKKPKTTLRHIKDRTVYIVLHVTVQYTCKLKAINQQH